jgi:hypothetical protein
MRSNVAIHPSSWNMSCLQDPLPVIFSEAMMERPVFRVSVYARFAPRVVPGILVSR